MSRDWLINGESMVTVKGSSGSGIANLSQLGLTADPIVVTPNYRHRDITLDAWGGEVPAEVQVMLLDLQVVMNFIHIDQSILDICLMESLGGVGAIGQTSRAGTRLGNNAARFAATNHYIGLNIASPINLKPYRFLYSFMTGPPVSIPLGTEKSVIQTRWRVIPYTSDPWQAGLGATNYTIWDNTADS